MFPPDLSQVEDLQINLGGETGAKLVRWDDTLFVLKKGKSPEHCRNEYYTNRAYTVLGVLVPEIQLYEGGSPAILSEYIDGVTLQQFLRVNSKEEKEKVFRKIAQDFVADCLLANWDVIGPQFDNIVIDKQGTPWRVDHGGGLEFKGFGRKKGSPWGPTVVEIDTMRNPDINKSGAIVFHNIALKEIEQQVVSLYAKKQALLEVVPPELQNIVEARLESLFWSHLSQPCR